MADQDKLKQVILNLLKNAIEATPPGGMMTIGTQGPSMQGPGEGHVRLSISDTGCGITPENRERIFDLFFTTKPRGTGLGLPICRRIVEDHGGRIAVEARPGEGTTFTVWIPLHAVDSSPTSAEE
jgi:signal transduction histidine kinase